jgi:pre-mRNA-processing factor 39
VNFLFFVLNTKINLESLNEIAKVFERGLKAIPLSIDLWIHYLTHVKQKHEGDREFIRSQFERALDACGLEFRSDKVRSLNP